MSTNPAEPDLPARPTVAPAAPWAFPQGRHDRLDNGLDVISYHLPGQHVLSLRLAVPLPITLEPRELEGVGTIMARTLDEGTAHLSAEEMAELLERRGIALGAGVGERGLVVDVDVTARHLPEALDLLRQALVEPAFGEAEVRRHVRTRLAEIEQERAEPGHRAALAFLEAFFDPSDRASRPVAGSTETVSRIDPAAVREHHARYVGPRGATVVLAGDLTGIDPAAVFAETLGRWEHPDVEAPAALPAPGRATDASRIVLVDRPGSVQSEIYLGGVGPDRTVEGGWAPYPVLSFVVGGAPQARLDAVLREEKGFTYGMRSGFRPRSHGGLFITSGSVRTEVTVEALDLALGILESARDGFEAQETQAGVDFLSKTAPGRYATADAVAEEAAARALDGLGTDHTTRTLAQMRELTPADLTAAYRRFVDGEWTVVVVGDAAAVQPGLEALGRGPVQVISG